MRSSLHIYIPRHVLIGLILLGSTVTVGALLYLYLPQAIITVHPKTETRSVTHEVILLASAKEPDYVHNTLPASTKEKELTERRTFERNADIIQDDYAIGEVTLINTLHEVQELLPNTHLRHEATGVFFLTDFPVAIPREGSIRMTVKAKEPGKEGNVPAGRFVIEKLPPESKNHIYAESSQLFSGGLVTNRAITQQEIDSAKMNVEDQARTRLLGEMTAELGGAPISKDLLVFDIVKEHASALVGSKAVLFDISLTVRARALVPDENDMLSLTLLALRSGATNEEEFISYEPSSFGYEIQQANFERGEMIVRATLTGSFAKKISPSIFSVDGLVGLSPEEARQHFTMHPSVHDARIVLSPFWVQSIPPRPSAIKITIAQAQK